jgi:hypothetical protein
VDSGKDVEMAETFKPVEINKEQKKVKRSVNLKI